MSMHFNPDPVEPESLPGWTYRQFLKLRGTLLGASFDSLLLKVTHVAPSKPREGEIREADGTNWDPGMGAGLYIRRAGEWVKLG